MKSGFLRRLLVPFIALSALFNWSERPIKIRNDGKKIDALNLKRKEHRGHKYRPTCDSDEKHYNNNIYKRRKRNKAARKARKNNRERR